MKQSISKLVLLTSVLAFFSAAAMADDEDVIKYRKNVMKAYGAHMAAAGAILQGKVKGPLASHAKALELTTQDIAADLFPAGSDFGETSAKDIVWSKRADFEKKAKDAEIKAAAFAKAVGGADAAAKFADLSNSCKACHKEYRKE